MLGVNGPLNSCRRSLLFCVFLVPRLPRLLFALLIAHVLFHGLTFVDWMSESDQQKNINNSRVMPPPADLSWDPAIVTSGNIATDMGPGEDAQPHWMASLQHLTEETSNHRLPFVQQFPTFNTGTQ